MTTPTPEELIAAPQQIAGLQRRLIEANSPNSLWVLATDAVALVGLQAEENARLSAQVAQLQGERAYTREEVRGLADSLDDHVEQGDVYDALVNLWRSIEPVEALGAATIQASGEKLEPTADDSSSLGAAPQPEDEWVEYELATLVEDHCGMSALDGVALADAILAKFTVSRRPALSEGDTPQASESRGEL